MKFIAYIFSFCICLFGNAQDDILTIADSMPQFPGGTSAMARFIQSNLRVPMDVLEGSKNEKAFVKFVVDVTGKVKNPEVVKPSTYKSFDTEALRVISQMPDWKPGLNNGKNVSVYMTLPISYKNIGVAKPEPVSPEHENAMKYWNEGHKLEQQEKFDKALEKYNKSLEFEPQNKYALFDKAKMHLALGDKNKARELWTNMIQKEIRKDEAEFFVKKFCDEKADPGKFVNELKAGNFFSKGLDDSRNGRYEAALHKFDSCLKYSADNKDALYNKAMMHHKLEQKKAACVTWNKLLVLSPEDKEVDDLLKKNCN